MVKAVTPIIDTMAVYTEVTVFPGAQQLVERSFADVTEGAINKMENGQKANKNIE